MMWSMVPLRSSVAKMRTSVVTWRKRRFFSPGGPVPAAALPPARDLLRIDIDELQLLAMVCFPPVDGGVVENMRLGTCFGQRLNMVGGVTLRAPSIMLATSA